MRVGIILINYLAWHYGRALSEFWRIYQNILSFVTNFFSVPILLRSYFSPWRRLGEEYPKNILEFNQFISVLVVNLLMRLVGIVMRTVIILIGLVAISLTIISLPIIFVIWLCLPPAALILMLVGLFLIFVP